MIKLEGLSKIYGKKSNLFTALDDISLEIAKGQTVAIVGKSGSGKSTLMHAMSGLDRPTEGRVLYDERDIAKMRERAVDQFRSQTIGFIFQSFFVEGNETCYSNVVLPLEIAKVPSSKRRQLVVDALEAVELGDKLNSRAKDLSGGQKQRLAIARAIVGSPEVIFADEPTGNLDSVTGQKVEQLLFDYAESHQATLIIVTHDPDLAARCQRQIQIVDGVIESDSGAKAKGGKK